MAFFTTNSCKFKECSLSFSSLGQLIEHIEDSHIDYDPSFLEKQEGQQPPALALSYVIKFVTDAAKHQPKEKKKLKLCKSSSPKHGLLIDNRDELDRLNSDSDNDESLILKLGSPYNADILLQSVSGHHEGSKSKPFMCPVLGCKKRYKNVNGMKYHARNGHKKDKDKTETKVKKTYKCDCGKSYRSAQGLRQHMIAQHPPGQQLTPSSSPSPKQTSITSSVTNSITSSLFTTSHMGLALANGSILLDPCTPMTSASIMVEPGTPNSQRMVPPSTSPAGFTIVTLPSASLGTFSSFVSSPGQQQTVKVETNSMSQKSQPVIGINNKSVIVQTANGGTPCDQLQEISIKTEQLETE